MKLLKHLSLIIAGASLLCGCSNVTRLNNPEAFPTRAGDTELSGLPFVVEVNARNFEGHSSFWQGKQDVWSAALEIDFRQALERRFTDTYAYTLSKSHAQVYLDITIDRFDLSQCARSAFTDFPGFLLFAPGWVYRPHELEFMMTCDIKDATDNTLLKRIRLEKHIELGIKAEGRGLIVFLYTIAPYEAPFFALFSACGAPMTDTKVCEFVGTAISEQLAHEVHTYLKTQVITEYDYGY